MVKITVETDCGNAPKRILLKDFNIACAEGNIDFIANSVTDDVTWELIGVTKIEGKSAFVDNMAKVDTEKHAELIVSHVITHGREGAFHGEIIFADGTKYAYCDVYEFSSAKGSQIKSIVSFMIEKQ